MKWLVGLTMAAALTLSTTVSASAQSVDTSVSAGKQTTGQVTSIKGSTVVVKTSAGETKTYQVTPTVISALKLEPGSEVVVDSTRLQTGRIVRLGAYTADVQLDQGGETKSYILPRESRRYLGFGDRVVVTPNLKLVRYDLYQLSSSDIRLQPAMVASSSMSSSSGMSSSSSSSSMTKTEVEQSTPMTSAPVESTPAPVESTPVSNPSPVQGLW